MALATIGAGAATGEPLYALIGAAAYVLGWVYVPDLSIFRNWLERKQAAQVAAEAKGELAQFHARRDALLWELSHSRRQRYSELAEVCRQIEHAAADGKDDPRVRKLEELMWTYLRLLTIEQSLDHFLETEARENVPAILASAQAEVATLAADVEALRSSGKSAALDTKVRLLDSRRELLETLEKRHERLDQAKNNRMLVVAEQERLVQQIKLIRADSIASKNATALSARINATVEHLEATNQWLSEMDQFRDLLTDLPQSGARVGFGTQATMVPPPLPRTQTRGTERA